MLHDRMLSALEVGERRSSDRVPMPVELTLFWHHDPSCMMRYAVIDAGDGGLRLRSSTPMLEGMTGTVLRLLPEGTRIDRSVTVAWCRPHGNPGRNPDGNRNGYEVGLRALT